MRGVVAVPWLALSACSFQHGVSVGDASPPDTQRSDADIDAPNEGLVSRNLVARYFIDEAAAGQSPTQLTDAAANPFPLAMTYTGTLSFTEVATQRGLHWTTPGDLGRASAPIDNTKITMALAGAKRWTYELVVDLRNATSGECRLISIGNGTATYGDAALITSDLTTLRLHVDATYAHWNVTFGSGRVVLHAVVDTTLATSTSRYQLFVNGTQALRIAGTVPVQDAGLVIPANDYLAIGNVEGAGRSPGGDVYYAAIYSDALTPAEITANTARLLANDDH
ncbi:MAG TPA: LamG-like jellyroll fold domain-containing protein [Kofleriaceae bacterium]|nr:LamG-like jellyroll fold domain-containing protein [Kofleriaceae bacterium]